jgi:integrase/recombinase XerC
MPTKPKTPWFRSDRNAYFVTFRGKQHNLGPEKEEAERLFHELLGRRPEKKSPRQLATEFAVADVCEKFLDWCEKHREPRTYDWYKDHIQSFISFLPNPAHMPVSGLKAFYVIEWIDAHPQWGDAVRRGAIIAVQRPFNWAAKLGYIDQSPLRSVEKPPAKRREVAVSLEQWTEIRNHYRHGDPFRDLLEFCWETGCRPQEARAIEARHVRLDLGMILIPPNEAKGKKRWRRILLEGRSREIIERLIHRKGTVFVNAEGRPWTRYAMSGRFKRLKNHLGVRYSAYALRHGFCQRLLEDGTDHLSVAELMGHANGQMVASVYSHMNKADRHLRAVLKRSADIQVAKR